MLQAVKVLEIISLLLIVLPLINIGVNCWQKKYDKGNASYFSGYNRIFLKISFTGILTGILSLLMLMLLS